MRLGYVCQYFTKEYRGPVTNLMDELSAHIDIVNYSSVSKHMQYYSGGEHAKRDELISPTLRLRRYPTALRISGLVFPKDLRRMLDEDGPDIIQTEEYYQPATRQCLIWAKSNKKPLIVNHRASSLRNRTLRERLFFGIANTTSKPVAKRADAFVCLSEAGKSSLTRVYPLLREKTEVIPNSIDPKAYSGADGNEFRKAFSISKSCPLLVSVARIHPQKRIDLLVKAFARVKASIPDAHLAIVGPQQKKERRMVDSIIGCLGVKDIIFCGPVPNHKIQNAYAAADVCAMTSEWEPFGYCLLEAMVQKKPQVAFDIGAVSEILGGDAAGYSVPFADVDMFAERVIRLFEDKRLSIRMGAAGLKRVKTKFNLKKNSKRLLELYGRCMK